MCLFQRDRVPIFYEVTAPNGKKNYLFGTMHLNQEHVTTLPKEVKVAFEGAHSLLVEADFSDTAFVNQIRDQVRQEWKNKHGDAHAAWMKRSGEMNRVVDALVKHHAWYVPRVYLLLLVALFPPGQLIMSVMQPESSPHCLDSQLEKQAKKKGKAVHSLEPLDKHIDVFSGMNFSYEEQRACCDHVIATQSKASILAAQRKVMNRYIHGEVSPISASNFLRSIGQDNRLGMRFFDNFLPRRDRNMVSNMASHFKKGNAFVAVGAAHLDGMTKELSLRGYRVLAIPMSPRIYPVLDFYERYQSTLISIGVALMAAGGSLALGLICGAPLLAVGLFVVSVALALAAMVQSLRVFIAYVQEPRLAKQAMELPVSVPSSPSQDDECCFSSERSFVAVYTCH